VRKAAEQHRSQPTLKSAREQQLFGSKEAVTRARSKKVTERVNQINKKHQRLDSFESEASHESSENQSASLAMQASVERLAANITGTDLET